ncbi:DNA repair protein complementing XP-C cells homolog [Penaeus chinensis]|uniref:DNA repair protein complementing XP-C cells homolog n=1 Tax=Penaeus chinensis TaxID=139456 RepID=UPI001FB835BB|nr:DNA repair protein complementing XP-C cells homolog [Penaeus chinensis]
MKNSCHDRKEVKEKSIENKIESRMKGSCKSKMEVPDIGNCDQRKEQKGKNQSVISEGSSKDGRSRATGDKVSNHRRSSRNREASDGTKVSKKSEQGSERQGEANKRKKAKVIPKETDDYDCNLDFSLIESKIFEGFAVPENKKSRTKDNRRVRTDRKIGNETYTNEKRSLAKKGIERKKSLEKNEASLKSHSKSSKKDKSSQKVSPKPSSSKKKTERPTERRTPVDKNKPNKVRSSEKKSAKVDSDSDMSDWEEVGERDEVAEMEELLSGSQPSAASGGNVQIELDAPNVLWGIKKRKRRTEEEMIEDYLRKSVNRSIKEVYENLHKTHLLCLFAHGRYVNQTLNSETLLGAALSIITDKNAYPPKRLDTNYLEKFVRWFSKKIVYKPSKLEEDYWDTPLEMMLAKRFERKIAISNRELVYMFVVVCRCLGMNIRLVLSLQPMSWKPSADVLIRPSKKGGEVNSTIKEPSLSQPSVPDIKESEEKVNKKEKKPNKKMLSSDTDEEPVNKKKNKKATETKKQVLSKSQKRKSETVDDDDDSDFDPEGKKIKKGPKASTSQGRKSGEKRSSDGDSDEKDKQRKKTGKDDMDGKKRKSEGLLEWAEVYVEEEEKWICVDIARGKIHCVAEVQVRMPSSSAYITAYNANLTVKDVTRRYISNWLYSEKKIRLCSKWWEKSLRAFRCARTRLDKEEDKEMDQNLHQQPLPRSIAEYKNHPLYALQRHLLKFEAIYPPDETPVGFIKGEPVFPRDSVYTLYSRETWIKEAKTVRVDEEPYKVVKARPKWDKNTCQVVKDRPLELFGDWQVEDYEPPVAKDGKVPRSEYGSVELFKPSMLPRGCVHIPISGLNRIARKLNIDCAPAMIGFDYHSGWSHPVYDGFVVCEEFKDTLIDAWNEDQAEQARKAEEKRIKRIYDNWKKLIQGMLIKERVREKYGRSSPSDDEEMEERKKIAKEIKKEEEESEVASTSAGAGKRKIKQEDIDAARPPLITHHVKNMKIDWCSNVVEMAKKSKKRTVRPRNPAKKKDPVTEKKVLPSSRENQSKALSVSLEAGSDSETDEEEKKAKIRAILDWGTKVVEANPDLSDDSENEGEKKSSSNFLSSDTHPFYDSVRKPMKDNVKKKKQKVNVKGRRKSLDEQEDGMSSASTSHSTTPEPDIKDTKDKGSRRASRRSHLQKKVTYRESEEESDEDISLDESDSGDHLYEPLKSK